MINLRCNVSFQYDGIKSLKYIFKFMGPVDPYVLHYQYVGDQLDDKGHWKVSNDVPKHSKLEIIW